MALCSTDVLTGQDGLISFKPPGTSICVRDFSAFGTDGDTSHISVPCAHDFRVGDPVIFTEEDGGNLDSSLTPSTFIAAGAAGAISAFGAHVAGAGYPDGTYVDVPLLGGTGSGAKATVTVANGGVTGLTITDAGSGYLDTDQLTAAGSRLGGYGQGFTIEVGTVMSAQPRAATVYYVVESTGDYIVVSQTEGGAAISMGGDGGTGTEDSPLPAHINISLADWFTVCNVRSFSLDIQRDDLDITTLPCEVSSGCDKLASFRSTQSGYAEATGTMEVFFTCDQETISNRLMSSSLLRSQQGARVKLYACAKEDGLGGIDDSISLFIDAEINITGMSFEVNPDDPSTSELSFSVTKMHSAFGMS